MISLFVGEGGVFIPDRDGGVNVDEPDLQLLDLNLLIFVTAETISNC